MSDITPMEVRSNRHRFCIDDETIKQNYSVRSLMYPKEKNSKRKVPTWFFSSKIYLNSFVIISAAVSCM